MIGYDCADLAGLPWRRHHGALIPLCMPHALPAKRTPISPSRLLASRAALARWEEDFDRLSRSPWWHVIKDEREDFAALSSNTKSKLRRGSKRFEAMPVALHEILREGYEVYCAAFARYDASESMLSEERFRSAVSCLPGETEFWGVRDRQSGHMEAFSENLVRDEACFYSTIWFRPDSLKHYAGYVLIHEMNKHYLNERRLRYVSDGARNLSHTTNVHEFLEQKFGFRRAYARLRVVYAPGVGFAVAALYPLRRWLSRCRRGKLGHKLAVLLEQERIRRACCSV